MTRPILATRFRVVQVSSAWLGTYDADLQLSVDAFGIPLVASIRTTEETVTEASRDNPDPDKWLAIEETITRADRDESRPRDAWVEETATKAETVKATDELAVIATNGHSKPANGKTNGSTIKLSLGATNVAFKIQEDAPSCAECGSIMVRNGSCYKCLNCGSTSGCS